MSSFKISDNSLRRLQIMTETDNGFEIAEADLTLRGPGELEGTAQSGLPLELHVANLARDGIVLQAARDTAKQILDRDPRLEAPDNKIIADRLRQLDRKEVNWSEIS